MLDSGGGSSSSSSSSSSSVIIGFRDGVMVEVKGSYRAAIIATCQHFGVAVTNEDIRLVVCLFPNSCLICVWWLIRPQRF